jgi:hypothetical protein
LRQVHEFDALQPEEVNPILEQNFRSAYPPAFVDVPSYLGWFAQEPPRLQFEYLKRVLQYLQWQFPRAPNRPWVLKNPTFLGLERDLLAVFPDACLIITHRHPAQIVASAASLCAHFHALYSEVDFAATMRGAAQMLCEGQALAVAAHAANRRMLPGASIVDVAYAKLTADGVGELERVYAQLERPFSSSTRTAVAQWERAHAQHRHGSHRYSLADCGLSAAQIDSRYRDYIAEFQHLF